MEEWFSKSDDIFCEIYLMVGLNDRYIENFFLKFYCVGN